MTDQNTDKRRCPMCNSPLRATPVPGSTNVRYSCPHGHMTEVTNDKGKTYLADGNPGNRRFLGG